MAIPSRRAGGVHVERPQRSEDERRGHRQAVEDDQQRRKSLPLTDHLHRHLDKLADERLGQRPLAGLLFGGHLSSSSNRSRRATTSPATSSMARPCTNAEARNLLKAASGGSASWAMTIPVA